MPSQKRRRILPQVHRNVENFAAQAGHKFDFRMWRALKMHPADGTLLARECAVDLFYRLAETGLGELVVREDALKKAAVIGDRQALDVGEAGEGRWMNSEPSTHAVSCR
jgi:hypothetical protein